MLLKSWKQNTKPFLKLNYYRQQSVSKRLKPASKNLSMDLNDYNLIVFCSSKYLKKTEKREKMTRVMFHESIIILAFQKVKKNRKIGFISTKITKKHPPTCETNFSIFRWTKVYGENTQDIFAQHDRSYFERHFVSICRASNWLVCVQPLAKLLDIFNVRQIGIRYI